MTLAVSGAVLIVVGTACSGNAWMAAGAMLVVGFLILFSGVINGYFAAGGTAAVLVFVLSVTVPAPFSAVGWRLAGWGLASAVGDPGRDADLATAGARHAACRHRPGLPGPGRRSRLGMR